MESNKKPIEELIKEERLSYFRKWRAANKDKVKQHNENYWKRKAEKRLKAGENNDSPNHANN